MSDLPSPLTAPETDLTDFPFTPIFRSRLFGSRFHARVSDAEWRAGVTLWLKSWDQVPAGSLPDDDVDLCRLAELGRDMKQWKRIKSGALHGWVKCSDGLLYHPVVAEGVNEAWERKRKQSVRGAKGAQARWHKHPEGMQQASSPDATSMQEAMLSDGNRQGHRQGESPPYPPCFHLPGVKPVTEGGVTRPAVNGWYLDTTWERLAEASRIDPATWRGDLAPIVAWLQSDVSPEAIVSAIERVASRHGYQPPRSLAYFDAAVREQPRKAA